MADYNIGAVSKLTGITPHNLRVWEKRYSLTLGDRSDSGRRIYSEADVERLSLIKQCIDLGHSVSNLTALSIDELKANLAQLNQANSSHDGQQKSYQLTVVSQSPYPFDKEALEERQIELTHTAKRLEQLPTLDESIDILIVESALITDELIQQLTDVKSAKSPKLFLFIYRIAQQDNLSRLRNLGIRPVRAPMEVVELEDILFRFVDRMNNQYTTTVQDWLDNYEPLERIFTDEQLDGLKAKPYNINCECPRHLSEIIKSLDAFENYSLQCQNRNDEDAALHAKLFKQTSIARGIMENLLKEVLDAEGVQV